MQRRNIGLVPITKGTRHGELTSGNRGIIYHRSCVLPMDRKLVRGIDGRLSVIFYFALQLESGGSNRQDQRFQSEVRRTRVEAGGQIVRKRFAVSVSNATI